MLLKKWNIPCFAPNYGINGPFSTKSTIKDLLLNCYLTLNFFENESDNVEIFVLLIFLRNCFFFTFQGQIRLISTQILDYEDYFI